MRHEVQKNVVRVCASRSVLSDIVKGLLMLLKVGRGRRPRNYRIGNRLPSGETLPVSLRNLTLRVPRRGPKIRRGLRVEEEHEHHCAGKQNTELHRNFCDCIENEAKPRLRYGPACQISLNLRLVAS